MSSAAGPPVWRARTAWPVLCVLLGVLAAFANAPGGAFVYDDVPLVRDNPDLDALGNIPRMFLQHAWHGTDQPSHLYRPLAMTTHVLERALFGPGPAASRWVSIACHAAASLAVLALLFALGLTRGAATAGAVLFAVHPVHTEAIDLSFNRSEVLVAGLYALALARLARGAPLWQPALCFLVGLFCRESMATLPIAVALLSSLVLRAAPLSALRSAALVGLSGVPALVLRHHVLSGHGFASAGAVLAGGPSAADRVAQLATPLADALRLLVAPANLRADYAGDYVVAHGAWLGLLAVLHVALVGGAIALRRRAPRAAFAILLFYVAMVPSTKLFADPAILAERFLYLPSVALAILAGLAAAALATRLRPAIATLAVTALAASGLPVCWARNVAWRDEELLWRAELESNPASLMARHNLGSVLLERGHTDEAITWLGEAKAGGSQDRRIQINLGVALDMAGRLDEAIVHLDAALASRPDDRSLRFNRAGVLLQKGAFAPALVELDRVLAERPDWAQAHAVRAEALAQLGRKDEASAARARAAALGYRPTTSAFVRVRHDREMP